MDDITRWYMHDVRIMPSMGKAKTTANGWICNHLSVIQRFYRVWSTSECHSALIYKRQFYKRFSLENDDPITA